jgi:regulator of sigma E protease
MTVLLFLLVLAALIFVHELGHFIAAKKFGIRVDEFAIGFPPKIFGWKKGETEYKINLVPLGGYVKIFGEDPNDESINGPDSARSFVNVAKWKQIIVLLSGIFMNLVFAWILISISFNLGMLSPIEDKYRDKAEDVSVMVLSVLKDSPGEKGGIKQGDHIIAIESGETKILNPGIAEVQNIIANAESELNIEYLRGVATGSVSVVPSSSIIEGKKAVGISMALVGIVKYGFFESFVEGAKLTAIQTVNITKGIYSFIFSAFNGKSDLLSQVAGPVGIASMVGDAKDIGLSYLLGLIAIISINLAMLNLVPFPALDGGRVLFVLIEMISRKKIKPVIANILNLVGFSLLILLMLVITYKDVLRLFK